MLLSAGTNKNFTVIWIQRGVGRVKKEWLNRVFISFPFYVHTFVCFSLHFFRMACFVFTNNSQKGNYEFFMYMFLPIRSLVLIQIKFHVYLLLHKKIKLILVEVHTRMLYVCDANWRRKGFTQNIHFWGHTVVSHLHVIND